MDTVSETTTPLLAQARRQRLNEETVARCAAALRGRSPSGREIPQIQSGTIAAWLADFARRWDKEENRDA